MKNFSPGFSKTNPVNLPSAAAAIMSMIFQYVINLDYKQPALLSDSVKQNA